jgi:hypothetical protein
MYIFLADDCDASSMSKFTGAYSRLYQTEQDCQCDNDHDECFLNNIMVNKKVSSFKSHFSLFFYSILFHPIVHQKIF